MLLELTAAAAAAATTDAAIHKKIFGSSFTLIISNEEMNDIIRVIKSLKESGLLIKGVSETIRNEEQREDFSYVNRCIKC